MSTLASLFPSEQMGTTQLGCLAPHLYPPKPSQGTPESTLVPGYAGEGVAVDGVEVIVVWHIMSKDFSVYHIAFTLLTRFVHGLWGGKHHGPNRNSIFPNAPAPGHRLTWQHLSSWDAAAFGLNQVQLQRPLPSPAFIL